MIKFNFCRLQVMHICHPLHMLLPQKEIPQNLWCLQKLQILVMDMATKSVLQVVGYHHCSAFLLPSDELVIYLVHTFFLGFLLPFVKGWIHVFKVGFFLIAAAFILTHQCVDQIVPINVFIYGTGHEDSRVAFVEATNVWLFDVLFLLWSWWENC